MEKTLRPPAVLVSASEPGTRRLRAGVLALALLLAACGGPDGADLPEGGAGPVDASKSTEPPPSPAALAIAGPGAAAHDLYAARGITCERCHPCGKRDPNGHAPAWMDSTAAGFHAYSANANLASCQGCHGSNLDGVGGSTSISCAECHGATWKTTCTLCHGGTDSATGAPPRTVWGRSAEAIRVGTHTAHLAGAHGLAAPVACSACHVVPASATSAGHANGATADVTFSGLAILGGAATWNRAAGTCATYCHGATLDAGGAVTAPVWTQASGAARACTACHGAPPPSHAPTSTACGTCHSGYTSTAVVAATHVDGLLQVAGSNHAPGYAAKAAHGYEANRVGLGTCKTCHGASLTGGTGPSCAACHATAGFAAWDTSCTFCHGNRATGRQSPPVDGQGQSARTAVSVGAHDRHVAPALAPAIACTVCHPARTGSVIADAAHLDGNGIAEVALSGLAAQGTATAWTRTSATAATCTTYCHGAFAGGSGAAPSWVSAAAMTCTSCHGAPPSTHAPTSTNCATCHPGYTATTVNAATHVNGVKNSSTTCTSCHGRAGQAASASSPLAAAPPVDAAGASTGVRVGAHQKHLAGGTYANALSCQTCHASVGTYANGHSDGVRNVGFTGAANANLRRGTFVAGTGTTAGSCSATWCHGAVINRNGGTSGGTATAPSWTATIAACTACHAVVGSSLPNNHTRSNHRVACSTCHGAGYTSTTGSSPTGNGVNKATHVDGVKTIVTVASGTGIRSWNPTTRTCTASCHGSETW